MRRMNAELETANSFLASVSMKIAKYLSPQIYKSIFSGEKDVAISVSQDPSAYVIVAAFGDAALEPVHPGRIAFGVSNPIFLSQ